MPVLMRTNIASKGLERLDMSENSTAGVRQSIELLGGMIDWVLDRTKGDLNEAECEYLIKVVKWFDEKCDLNQAELDYFTPKMFRFCAMIERLEDRTKPTEADILQYPGLDIQPSVSLLRSA